MRPETAEDIAALMDGYITSAALNTALQMGVFWLLDEAPASAAALGARLGLPGNRCRFLLEILAGQGLLQRQGEVFLPSETARRAILQVYSRPTWAALAGMATDRMPAMLDLTEAIGEDASAWDRQGRAPPGYFRQIREDRGAAETYSLMLQELHLPLAQAIAGSLDLSGKKWLLDLGGGSGGISTCLLQRFPALEAVVADVATVCDVGRRQPRDPAVAARLAFQALDFDCDALPSGFDVVLACDTGPYSADLFRKISYALRPEGRLLLVEQFPGDAPLKPPWITWSFRNSLHDARYQPPGFAALEALLDEGGFGVSSKIPLPERQDIRWARGWWLVEAVRRGRDGDA